jgi:hypothetical protein
LFYFDWSKMDCFGNTINFENRLILFEKQSFVLLIIYEPRQSSNFSKFRLENVKNINDFSILGEMCFFLNFIFH